MPPITLYVLYNADASILGKARYSYRKLTRSKAGEPECAACDITHGGLSLQETPSWTAAKKEIETQPETRVVQWHRDELSPTVGVSRLCAHNCILQRSKGRYCVADAIANRLNHIWRSKN